MIVVAPEPVLRQVAKPIKKIDKRILGIIAEMEKALIEAKNPEGVGLAAPQIGYSLRIFLVRPTKKTHPKLYINPEITEYSEEKQAPELNDGVYEGCLSVPNHYSPIERSLTVTIKYQDNNLKNHTETLTGFSAHIVQHELDHLNGILFIDRCLEQGLPLFRVEGKKWEEVEL